MSKSLAADRPAAINLIYRNLPELSAAGGMLHSTSLLDIRQLLLRFTWKLTADSRLREVMVGCLEAIYCFIFLSLCGVMWVRGTVTV